MLQKIEMQGPFCMNCREQGSHARGVHPTQDTSRTGTARVKQEEESDTRLRAKQEKEIWKTGTGGQ